MHSVSMLARLGWASVGWLLLPAAPVAGASGLAVQQIGDVGGRIAEAVAEEAVSAGVALVPLSWRLDAHTTPIIPSSPGAATGPPGCERRSAGRTGRPTTPAK